MKAIATLAVAFTLCAGLGFASAGNKVKGRYERPYAETGRVQEIPSQPMPSIDRGMLRPNAAVPTTLTGWYDYQSNGGSVQEIRVNPANGNIHVTWMLSFDSTAGSNNAARRVAYAFSTDGGASWDNFNNLYVPGRRGGFPTIDLGQGPIAGCPIIADHSIITAGNNQSTIFIDSPEGSGAFAEIAPPTGFGTDEAIWPYVAGAADGSVIIAASRNTANTAYYARTADFLSWSPLTQVVEVTQSGGRNPVHANTTGRVGLLYNNCNGTAAVNFGNWWLESTDNGQTWTTPVNIFSTRIDTADADTMDSYVHCDFVYNGETPLFVFSEFSIAAASNRQDIVFWSQATGFKVAAPYDSLRYGPYNNQGNPQRFYNLLTNFPTIGMSGNTIVIAYQAFQPDTDRWGWNYSDLWYVTSSNGGNTWAAPQRITNTHLVDERYPSVSKWNAPGEFNIVWTQKTGASGLYAFPGSQQPPAPDTVRAFQMFEKISLQFQLSVAVASGWNLISNPVTNPVPDDSAKHIFPTIASRVFRFNNGYVAGDTMGNGIGYWGKFPGATTQPITGGPRTRDSINVITGWNIVGTISNSVDTSTIVSVPAGLKGSNWFGYAGGYAVVSQLIPGKAYWVKSNAPGKFVFANPPAAGSSKSQVSGGGSLDALSSMTITDSKGGSQTLYFGMDPKNEIRLSMFTMPPGPPAGAFDARFETAEGGSMVQTYDGQRGREYTVAIQSEAYPLTVMWNVKDASYELRAGKTVQTMRGEGAMKIANSDVQRIGLRLIGASELPMEYALAQNYPNPFNPGTTIRYALPKDSRVNLKLYNVLGQEVATLVNEDQKAGYQSVHWDASNYASGVYLYRLEAGSFTSVKKLLLIK